jgi:hypothetical protein
LARSGKASETRTLIDLSSAETLNDEDKEENSDSVAIGVSIHLLLIFIFFSFGLKDTLISQE